MLFSLAHPSAAMATSASSESDYLRGDERFGHAAESHAPLDRARSGMLRLTEPPTPRDESPSLLVAARAPTAPTSTCLQGGREWFGRRGWVDVGTGSRGIQHRGWDTGSRCVGGRESHEARVLPGVAGSQFGLARLMAPCLDHIGGSPLWWTEAAPPEVRRSPEPR